MQFFVGGVGGGIGGVGAGGDEDFGGVGADGDEDFGGFGIGGGIGILTLLLASINEHKVTAKF